MSVPNPWRVVAVLENKLQLILTAVALGTLEGERALLDHDAHDLVQGVGSSHGGVLGVGVVGGLDSPSAVSSSFIYPPDEMMRGEGSGGGEGGGCKKEGFTYSHLDDVGANQVDAVQAAQYGAQLAGAPAARLGGAGGGGKGRVERVNVERQVDGVGGADAVQDAADDAVGANRVNLARLDNLEAAVAVVLVVARPAQRRADAGVDVGVVAQQPLHGGVVKVRSVVDAGHLGGGAAKDLGFPYETIM
jgi:hypothetical protein